jgi:DivIVA domain-containing protein
MVESGMPWMTLFFVLLAIGVIAAGFWAWSRTKWQPVLPATNRDRRPDTLDGQVQFDVVMRGYRMDEVDATIADLEEQIRRLEKRQ